MDKTTKVYFTFMTGYADKHEDEFTLEELGFDPAKDSGLEEFLEQEYLEWRSNFIDGGWSFEKEK